ncbi:hypothetical protein V8E36_005298 [Tilletia maclaganii]
MTFTQPLLSVYYPDFIAANQEKRADDILPGKNIVAHVEQICKDIRDFKAVNGLDSVVVIWTANTDRYIDIIPGVNDTASNLLKAVVQSLPEVPPSTVIATACILENAPYFNEPPRTPLCPTALSFTERHKAFIGGDDPKTGQAMVKSVLAELVVNAGIKPLSIASYDHLGNNDGHNLSSEHQFKSKERGVPGATKKTIDGKVVADKGEHPDDCIVIKPSDSLLASPRLVDPAILGDLMTRIQYVAPSDKPPDGAEAEGDRESMYSVLSPLSYSLKASLCKPKTDVVNSLSRQRAAVTNMLRALIGLSLDSDLLLQTRVW